MNNKHPVPRQYMTAYLRLKLRANHWRPEVRRSAKFWMERIKQEVKRD